MVPNFDKINGLATFKKFRYYLTMDIEHPEQSVGNDIAEPWYGLVRARTMFRMLEILKLNRLNLFSFIGRNCTTKNLYDVTHRIKVFGSTYLIAIPYKTPNFSVKVPVKNMIRNLTHNAKAQSKNQYPVKPVKLTEDDRKNLEFVDVANLSSSYDTIYLLVYWYHEYNNVSNKPSVTSLLSTAIVLTKLSKSHAA